MTHLWVVVLLQLGRARRRRCACKRCMDRLDPGRTRNLWSPDADCVFRILPKFVGALGVPMAEWKPGVVANPGVEKGGWPNSGSNCGAVRRKMGRSLDWRLTSGSLDVGEGVSLLSGHAAPGSRSEEHT